MGFIKKIDKHIFLFLGLAAIILWQALVPGYVLGLDMIFTPGMKATINPDRFYNFLPVGYLIYWFGLIIPVWLIQKIIFLILFFNIGYLSYKYLPVGEEKTVRLFSAIIYLVNPFVYSRFLAGQWYHLMAYGFLPLFVHFLFVFHEKKDLKSGLQLFGALFLIGLFSIHFFTMAVLTLFVWFLYYSVKFIYQKKCLEFWKWFKNLFIGGVIFLVFSSYWVIPALTRPAPIEQRFGSDHWQAFSAGGYENIDPFLNVASLNGFWGERNPWAKYFVWPQDYALFWVAFSLIAILILIGLVIGLRNAQKRPVALFFCAIGIFSLIFSTGVGETVFKGLNLWLFNHISFWSGFRDSQKFSGFLALSYAFFTGLGLKQIFDLIEVKTPSLRNTFLALVFIIPVCFGFLVWGGFHKQIQPVWYPQSWFEVKNIIDADTSGSRVLFLPWHGYLSLNFNNNLVSANPAKRFFGEKAVVSRSVELDEIYDQEQSREYLILDKVVGGEANMSPAETADCLINQKIGYVVFFQDLMNVDNLKYEFLKSDRFKVIIADKDVVVYKISDN